MKRAPLLAKSKRGMNTLTLFQHLLDTERAAEALFRSGTRWARAYLRLQARAQIARGLTRRPAATAPPERPAQSRSSRGAARAVFKLEPQQHALFLLHLRIAALFHDIGKANEDFQDAMMTKEFKRQSLRHEHLSALLLCEPSVSAWLSSSALLDMDVVVAAVLSHHLKASSEDGEWQVLRAQNATPIALFFDDDQVCDALERVARVAELRPFAGSLPAPRYVHPTWQPVWQALFDRADRFASQIRRDPVRLRLCLAVKAGLIACDSVSSGLWREAHDIGAWIEGIAHSGALAPDDIDAQILDRRIAELGGSWKGWHGFQKGAAAVGRRGLLLAACGSGKTLAAWRWASAVSKKQEIGRVIFLYPTRGTATEGFRDYVAHAPEGHAALVHGTSEYELTGMMANPDETPPSFKGKNMGVDESEARLFALGLWGKRYFSATVDQFLGFIEHSYGGLCLLPALADAAVIFDEIHSYDPKMWNALVAFLERFDVPVLCMTATLPPSRRKQLEERCGLQSYPTANEMQELKDLEDKETCKRYRLNSASLDRAIDTAVAAVKAGQRVLWVVNTVRRCQKLARTLKLRLGASQPVGVYHSRFKLEDRQDRHRATVDAFRAPPQGEPPPAIAITTQVCEMSLDLDADFLITEHAPISSLVQRFGRANRHLRRGRAFRATLLTYAPESAAPYDKNELEAASKFLAELSNRDVSQRDLAEGLVKYALSERNASGSTAFIHGGYFATAGALRDSDDVGAPVILDCDVARFKELRRRGQPTDGLKLTVPKQHARAVEGSGLPVWLKTADGTLYDSWLGFVVDEDLLLAKEAAP